MSKKRKIISLSVYFGLIIILLIAVFLVPSSNGHEAIEDAMKDSVLHEYNYVLLWGIKLNPGLVSAYLVTALILVIAILIRIFAIPRFKMIPGKMQLVIEEIVKFFSNLANENSPHYNRFLGAYIFGAGVYICIGTLFELLGIQIIGSEGQAITLPAPLSDINGAIAIGCFSYLVILFGGIRANKAKGILLTLKEFSLPISMSFRLFGALLSGLLVTDLVYHYISLSFVLPVVVGVLFTLMHAVVQTYVLTMLTSLFYGEVSEKKKKIKKSKKAIA